MAAFLVRSRDADDAAAFQLGDLTDDGADRARGGGHHDRLARHGLADIEQAEIGGGARHAEHTHISGKRRGIAREFLAAIEHGIFLPADNTRHDIAFLETGIVGFLHDRQRAAAHHIADLHRRHVLLHVAHPDAVRGIEREIHRTREELARARLGNRLLDQFQIARLDVAHRAALQKPLPVRFCHVFLR